MPRHTSMILAGAFFTAASVGLPASAMNLTRPAYKFELAGAPQPEGGGKSVVTVRLTHISDGKPVSGASIAESRADMGPEGMGAMSATVKPLPSTELGTYRFEIANGAVWQKPGKWELTLSASVPGEERNVRGSVDVDLAP